jgi:hypothetical protein
MAEFLVFEKAFGEIQRALGFGSPFGAFVRVFSPIALGERDAKEFIDIDGDFGLFERIHGDRPVGLIGQ